jgi:hypothetical protein
MSMSEFEPYIKQNEALLRQNRELKEALRVIAGGYTDKDTPSLDLPPLEFRSAMWTWSQKKAKEALEKANGK